MFYSKDSCNRGLERLRRQADRAVGFIPHKEMAAYYSEIDVLVCVSKIEGTPNPILEAVACGVPVISTDVGIVPEVLGRLQRELILPERSVEALMAALIRINIDRSLLAQISAENTKIIESWDWSRRVKAFEMFFGTVFTAAPRQRSVHAFY